MRRFTIGSTAIALAAAGAVLTVPFGTAAQAATPTATRFALASSGFGTFVQGGQVPAGSGATAYQAIGCTNLAGLTRYNTEASLTVPGLGILTGVSTKVWTQERRNVVSAYARHSIAGLTLDDSPSGTLRLTGISSVARAFHSATGFHHSASTQVGSITLTPAVGAPQTFPAPTPGHPTVIPGVATIAVGDSGGSSGATGARAWANALDIDVVASGTRARVAHTAARISGGIVSGVFGGSSNATRATGLADKFKSGPTPLSIMPCQGTQGVVKTRSVARLDLSQELVVRGLTSSQMARQSTSSASGYERGAVASVNLADGHLVVRGIVGRAAVTRTTHGLTRTANGTSIARILVNGRTRVMPDSGVLTVPGLARLENRIVTRQANGISVTALRITLLDGTAAVINLGQAKMQIRGSGL